VALLRQSRDPIPAENGSAFRSERHLVDRCETNTGNLNLRGSAIAREGCVPTEERHITFNDAEAAAAAQRFVRKRGKRMLGVAIRHIKPIANGDALDGVHLIGNNGIERVNIDLSLAELTAALLSDCFSRKIPIPRRAEKQVQFTGGRFVLLLRVSNQLTVDVS
jgi:hypothetical protein